MNIDGITHAEIKRRYGLDEAELRQLIVDSNGTVSERSVVELVLRDDPAALYFEHPSYGATLTQSGRFLVRSQKPFDDLPQQERVAIRTAAHRRASLDAYFQRTGAMRPAAPLRTTEACDETIQNAAPLNGQSGDEDDGINPLTGQPIGYNADEDEDDGINPLTGQPVGFSAGEDEDDGINPLTGLPVGGDQTDQTQQSDYFEKIMARIEEKKARKQRRKELAWNATVGFVKILGAVGTGLAEGLAAGRPSGGGGSSGSPNVPPQPSYRSPQASYTSTDERSARRVTQKRYVVRVWDNASRIVDERSFSDHGPAHARAWDLKRLYPPNKYRIAVILEYA